MPESYELPERESELLAQLIATGAPCFEHDPQWRHRDGH